MKILHVVDSMEVGGAETLVSQMCQLQRAQGHDVAVYAVAALGALGERMRANGFHVRSNVGSHLTDSTFNFYRLFRESRPDVVHIHNPTPTIYASLAARLAGTASIISTRHSLVAPPHDRVAETKYSIAARFCDWIVGICDATTGNLKSLRTIPPEKIVRIYNGATPLVAPSLDKQPSKSDFTLLFVGRFQPVKNLPLLLNAFRIALDSAPDLKMWMVGDGTERTELERLSTDLQLSGSVTFWGQQLDVAKFFSAADVFVMSSISEGLPVSLLQAFSLGLPAIVTDVGGMAEVVRSANAGVVIPNLSAPAMAAAMLQMRANKTQRMEFASNAYAAFEANFNLQTMVDAYMKIYLKTRRARKRGKTE
jgi:L-malate glycosyltransferase